MNKQITSEKELHDAVANLFETEHTDPVLIPLVDLKKMIDMEIREPRYNRQRRLGLLEGVYLTRISISIATGCDY